MSSLTTFQDDLAARDTDSVPTGTLPQGGEVNPSDSMASLGGTIPSIVQIGFVWHQSMKSGVSRPAHPRS